ncbi:MAG: hypothetical protein ORO03_05915, partial [Alphaproteobacteria bacterium]|nr:hypothetical protein [Alphaproteobacteria bacterium]
MKLSNDDVLQTVRKLKCDDFAAADALHLAIYDHQQRKVGKMIPVGNWILNDAHKITEIQNWRQN